MTNEEYEEWIAAKIAAVPHNPAALRREAEAWRNYASEVEAKSDQYQDPSWEMAFGELMAERFEKAAAEIEAAK